LVERHPIEKYRRARGLRQSDLAERVGVNENSVLRWEKGATPRPQHLPRIAEALGVDPLQLDGELAVWVPPEGPTRKRRVDLPARDAR
jgi:transcriptional regulator with XRE-family HTH domain